MAPTTPATAGAPRLAPVADPDDDQRELMWNGMERGATPLNIFATLAHNPALTRRVNALGHRFLHRGTIGARAREVVILRSAYRSGSEYEFGQHTVIGQECGLTPGEVARLAQDDIGDGWSPAERRLVAMTDELAAHDVVSDETWAGLRGDWDDGQLVEALLLPGFYAMLAGFLNSVRVRLEDDAPGWPAPAGATAPPAPAPADPSGPAPAGSGR